MSNDVMITIRLTRGQAGLAANALRAEASNDRERAHEEREFDASAADEIEQTARDQDHAAAAIEKQLGQST